MNCILESIFPVTIVTWNRSGIKAQYKETEEAQGKAGKSRKKTRIFGDFDRKNGKIFQEKHKKFL